MSLLHRVQTISVGIAIIIIINLPAVVVIKIIVLAGTVIVVLDVGRGSNRLQFGGLSVVAIIILGRNERYFLLSLFPSPPH